MVKLNLDEISLYDAFNTIKSKACPLVGKNMKVEEYLDFLGIYTNRFSGDTNFNKENHLQRFSYGIISDATAYFMLYKGIENEDAAKVMTQLLNLENQMNRYETNPNSQLYVQGKNFYVPQIRKELSKYNSQ